jgi:hypothetical protein
MRACRTSYCVLLAVGFVLASYSHAQGSGLWTTSPPPHNPFGQNPVWVYPDANTACYGTPSWQNGWEPWFDGCGVVPGAGASAGCSYWNNNQCPGPGAIAYNVYEIQQIVCDPPSVPVEVEGALGCSEPAPECPSGQELLPTQIGGQTIYICIDIFEPDDICTASGYWNNSPVCAEEEQACENDGGTWSIFSDQPACVLPREEPDPIDLPPDCGGGLGLLEYIPILNSDGSWQCGVVYPYPDDLPGVGNPGENNGQGDGTGTSGPAGGNPVTGAPPNIEILPDTDGDGVVNTQDPDIDGDGITNDQDPDIDGDGIDNGEDEDIDGDGVINSEDGDMDGDGKNNGADEDIDGDGVDNDTDTDDDGDGVPDAGDGTPFGPQETEDGTGDDVAVKGGGNCSPGSMPSCSGGDPIMCAVLVQTWHTRCAFEVDDDAFDGLENATVESIREEVDLGAELGDVFQGAGTTAACPGGISIAVGGTSLVANFGPFCDLAAMIRPIVLLLSGLVSLRIVMRGFA